MATAIFFQTAVNGRELTALSESEIFDNSGLLSWGYGFGAPYVLEGALSNADPGCGVEDFYQVLSMYTTFTSDGLKRIQSLVDNYPQLHPMESPIYLSSFPLLKFRMDIKEALECLLDDATLEILIDNFINTIKLRLKATDDLLDINIDSNNVNFYYHSSENSLK